MNNNYNINNWSNNNNNVLFNSSVLGEFFWRRARLELHRERGRVNVLATARYTKQHGSKSYRGLGEWIISCTWRLGKDVSGKQSQREAREVSSIPVISGCSWIKTRLPTARGLYIETTPGCIYTLWWQSWDLNTLQPSKSNECCEKTI